MDSAPGEGRLPRTDLRDSSDHRFVWHPAPRLRPPAGRGRRVLQQAQEIETRPGTAVVHIRGSARVASVFSRRAVRGDSAALPGGFISLRAGGAYSGVIDG